MRTWPGLLLVPLIALGHLTLNYALVPWVCSTGRQDVLHWISLVSLALALAITFHEWCLWRTSEHAAAGTAMTSRMRFAAGVSTLTSAFFTLVILGLWSPQWIVSPCAG